MKWDISVFWPLQFLYANCSWSSNSLILPISISFSNSRFQECSLAYILFVYGHNSIPTDTLSLTSTAASWSFHPISQFSLYHSSVKLIVFWMEVTISSLFEFVGLVSYTLVLTVIVTSKNTSFKSAFYTICFSTGKIYKKCKVLITDLAQN